jgi:hypothetical protein
MRAGIPVVALIGLAVGLGCALGGATGSARAEPKLIEPGLTLERILVTPGSTRNYLRADTAKIDVRILSPLVPDLAAPSPVGNYGIAAKGLFLADYLRRYRAAVVLAGGYTVSLSPPTPLGLVKSNGVTTNYPAHVVTWAAEAVFCSDRGRALIEPFRPSADYKGFRDCIQAGPLLLLNGAAPTDVPSVQASPPPSYNRIAHGAIDHAFVCIASGSRIVLGLISNTELKTLVADLQQPAVGCVSAMRLDVGALALAGEVIGDDKFLYPSAIGLLKAAE